MESGLLYMSSCKKEELLVKGTILIVDDEEINRMILKEIFKEDYNILEAADGIEAINIIKEKNEELKIILLDIIMPNMNGFGVLSFMKEYAYMDYIPVILITSDTSIESEIKGYDMGVAEFIEKPFDAYIIRKRIKNSIDLHMHKNHLEKMVKEQTEKLQKTHSMIIDTLSTVVEFRNLESAKHIHRIKYFVKILLEFVYEYNKEYGLTREEIDIIVEASTMHDIGKIAIPDSILLKPGRFNSDEFEIMKTHTTRGCEIIKSFSSIENKKFYEYCYDISRHHHEKYDGKGYPDGLKEEEISIAAQIVSLADVYDALVSERIYKPAYSKEKAFDMIMNGECGAFSPQLLNCFVLVRPQFEAID